MSKIDDIELSNEELLTKYHYLIVKIAGQYSRYVHNYNLYDDMYQECALTLISCKKNYKPELSSFCTYLYRQLCNACLKITHKNIYTITMTSRNYFTNKKRMTKVDIYDLDNLIKPDINKESFIERTEREEDYITNLKRICKCIEFIKDRKQRLRLVNILTGKCKKNKKISDKDINTIKEIIREHKL